MNSIYSQEDIDSTEICTPDEIAGTYQMMLHPYKVDFANNAYSSPGIALLKKNGQVSGDFVGTWRRKAGTSFITLKVRPKGTGSSAVKEYYGVVLPQVYSGTNAVTVGLTAISTDGVSIWGSNMNGNYAVDYNYTNIVKNNMPVTSFQLIKADVDLSFEGLRYGTNVSWTSSHPDVFSDTGNLMVPYVADGDTIVTVALTCTTQKDNYAYDYKRQVRIRTNKAYLPLQEDVNKDGVIDTQDVLCVYQQMQDGSLSIKACDVNQDGIVDTQDVLAIYERMKQ